MLWKIAWVFFSSAKPEVSFNNNAMKFFVLEVENCLCVTLPRTKMISFSVLFFCEINLVLYFCCRLATAAFSVLFFVGSLWWLFLPSVLLQSHDDGLFQDFSRFLKEFSLTKSLFLKVFLEFYGFCYLWNAFAKRDERKFPWLMTFFMTPEKKKEEILLIFHIFMCQFLTLKKGEHKSVLMFTRFIPIY